MNMKSKDLSLRDSRVRDIHSGLSQSDLRRERARLAQQRSRARTRTELQTLHARVEQQSNAIDEMTRIFLDLINGALSQPYIKKDQPTVRRIRDHMQHFLTVTRSVIEAETDEQAVEEDANLESSPDFNFSPAAGDIEILPDYSSDPEMPDMQQSRADSWQKASASESQQTTDIMPSSRIQSKSSVSHPYAPTSMPARRKLSPLVLSHGILAPFLDTTARDTRRFLTDRRNINAFAVRLYWNAMRFGLAMVDSGGEDENVLANQIFYYALKHDTRMNIVKRLRKRLFHMPKMPLLLSSSAAHTNTAARSDLSPDSAFYPKPSRNLSDSESDAGDLEEEAEALRYIRELNKRILKTMSEDGEDISNYLDVFAVQSRFLHVWGIDATTGIQQEEKGRSESLESGYVSDPEHNSFLVQPQYHALDQDINFEVETQDSEYEEFRFSTAPLQSAWRMSQLRDALPRLNTPPAISKYWTTDAMMKMWAAIIMFLCMHARCLGNSVTFPVSAVDDAARAILLAGAV